MYQILRHNDEKGMTRKEILQAASALVIAGSETTATLLSGSTFYLLKNPDCLRRVTDEVRGAFASADDIKLSTVEKLPYLCAVLEESLRIYPPVPAVFLRRTKPDGLVVDGKFVPGNVSLLPSRKKGQIKLIPSSPDHSRCTPLVIVALRKEFS